MRRYQRIQTEKNNALYVGVRRGNHQIVRPFQLPRSKATIQVRTVNNALLGIVEGTLNGERYYDEVFDDVFRSRRLLKTLKQVASSLN